MDLAKIRTRLRARRDDAGYSATKLDGFINESLAGIYNYRDWSWLRREISHSVRAPYTQATPGGLPIADLTITGVKDLAYVTMSGEIGRPIYGHVLLSNNRAYRVVNVIDTTHIQIDPPWIDATGVYSASVLNHEIALPRGVRSIQSIVLNNALNPQELVSATGAQARSWDLNSRGVPRHYATTRNQSLPQPLSAPAVTNGAGTGITGTYTYWQSYFDPATGAESALSPASTPLAVVNDPVLFTPVQRGDFFYKVYRSEDGKTTPHLVSENLSIGAVYSDSWPDEALQHPQANEGAGNEYVTFWPVPNDDYQILMTCQMAGPELLSDNDDPFCPDTFLPVILDGAEYYSLTSIEEQGRANQCWARYQEGLAKLSAADAPDRATLMHVNGRSNRHSRFTDWSAT